MRSPIKVTVSPTAASGDHSPWVPIDYVARTFNVGVFCSFSPDAAGITYSVEITPDNPNNVKGNSVVSLTRVGLVATLVLSAPHGLSVGDAVKIYNSGDANFDGNYTVVTAPTPNSLTFAVANTGALAASPYTMAVLTRVFALAAALTAATTPQAGSITTPCLAVRLKVSAWTAGSVTLELVQGLARG